jgi:hypothetical protein
MQKLKDVSAARTLNFEDKKLLGLRNSLLSKASFAAVSSKPEYFRLGRCEEIEFLDQFDKKLESFATCYSQSLLLADFKENHTLLWF